MSDSASAKQDDSSKARGCKALSVMTLIRRSRECVPTIGRSRKAFGFLFAALPADLRQLVADVPQGYAFGIWSFLEKKFRNTEQDSVMALWERLTTVSAEPDETFDAYKARVDSVTELLTHAKQTVPPGLYASLLLWRLQPRYATAVLTLKTGDRLKDPATIDWSAIAEYMGQYERSQLALGDTDGAGDRAMAMRNKPAGGGSKSKKPPGDFKDVECFNCHKYGHYANDCPLPDRRQKLGKKKGANPRHSTEARGAKASASDGESDVEGRSRRGGAIGAEHANMARGRGSNRFAELTESDDDQDEDEAKSTQKRAVQMERSYLARVLVGLATTSRPSQTKKNTMSNSPEQLASAQSMKHRSGETHSTANPEPRKKVAFGPQTEAHAKESSPCTRSPKSLDVALRTTARAIDSGATVSITGNKNTLVDVRRCMPMPIAMADKTIVNAVYKGDMPMRLPLAESPGEYVSITIRDVYYHERIDANLLSWGVCVKMAGRCTARRKEHSLSLPRVAESTQVRVAA